MVEDKGIGERNFSLYFTLVISLLTGAFAITAESLWIDEANSAFKAMQPSLHAWWNVLVAEKGSELQMPFHMLYLWAWEKIAGPSEFALRAANIPWLLLAHYSLYRACKRSGLNPIPLLTLASLNPFLWFYLNEARPYVMQYAGSCLVLCGLNEISKDAAAGKNSARSSSLWFLAIGLLVLAGSSMLGAAWTGSALLALVYICARAAKPLPLRDAAMPLVLLLLAGLPLVYYYLWTLQRGGGGSRAGGIGIESTLYIPYELLGFTGLGPSRIQLREFGFDFSPKFLGILMSLAVVEAVVIWAAARVFLRPQHRNQLLAASIYGVLAALLVWTFGLATHFRILGRHLTPLAPLVPVVLALGVTELWRTRRRFFAVAMCLLWFISAALLRFAPRHRKDDYRAAAAEARVAIARGNFVWWAADRAGADYYKVPLDQQRATLLANPLSSDLTELKPADLVVLSKRDLYDANGAITAFLTEGKYNEIRKLPAFTLWQR